MIENMDILAAKILQKARTPAPGSAEYGAYRGALLISAFEKLKAFIADLDERHAKEAVMKTEQIES